MNLFPSGAIGLLQFLAPDIFSEWFSEWFKENFRKICQITDSEWLFL